MKKLRVALVHDYIKEYGGAERVLETLHEIFPEAPVYTSVYLPEFLGPHRKRFEGWKIKTSWLQYVPFRHKLISPFRILSPFVFSQFDLSDYDVVIVSATGAYFPNMVRTKKRIRPSTKAKANWKQESRIKRAESDSVSQKEAKSDLALVRNISGVEGAVQICYCHTPPRYLYGYVTAREWKKNKVMIILMAVASHFLRMVDFEASKKVDFYIANSEEVASRIKKFYRREATVIYPPVDSKNSKNQESRIKNQVINKKVNATHYNLPPTTYYLTGGRLARAKHVDIIVRACSELGVGLKVFGKSFAGYEEELREIPNTKSQISNTTNPRQEKNIQFLGEVSDEEKYVLMRGAKAFLFASEDEDFGITPVEAMGAGLPVIAHRSGGVQETVIDGVTGVFFTQLQVASLKKAIEEFEGMKFDPKDCIAQAKKFSKEAFVEKLREVVYAGITRG